MAPKEREILRPGRDFIDEGFGVIYEREVKRRLLERLISDLQLSKVLEIGCGIGFEMGAGVGIDSLVFASEGRDVTLADMPLDNMKDSQKIWGLTDLSDRVKFVRCDPQSLPFPEGSFDLVFSSFTLEHVDDPVRCLKEMARVSREFILIFATNYLNVGHLFQKLFPRFVRAPWETESRLATSLASVSEITEKVGLRIVEKGGIDIPLFAPVSGLSIKRLKPRRRWKLRILSEEENPRLPRALRLFTALERQLPTAVKALQAHMLYVLAEK